MYKENNNLNSRMGTEKIDIREWFLRYSDSVYTFIRYRIGNDKQMAADILQETFLTALKQKEQYRPDKASPLAWLTLLSRNHIKSTVRQNMKFANFANNNSDGLLPEVFNKIANEPLPDDILEKAETAELVQITLDNLPQKYRNCLEQFYRQEKTTAQIAAENGQTGIAARVMLHRAKKAFKKNFLKTAKTFLSSEPAGKRDR